MSTNALMYSDGIQAYSALDPTALDLFKLVAQFPAVMSLPLLTMESRTLTWYNDENLALTTTLAAAVTNTADVSWPVTSAAHFRVGDLLLVEDSDNEIVRITGIATNTLTVTRNQVGSSGGDAHADALTVRRVGHAAIEGATPGAARMTTLGSGTNYMQKFEEKISLTGEAQIVKGPVADLMTWKTDRRWIKMMQQLEGAIFYQQGGSAGTPGSAIPYMNGILGLCTTHAYAVTSTDIGGSAGNYDITHRKLNTFLAAMINTGFSGVGRMYCGNTAFRAMNDMMRAASINPVAELSGAVHRFVWRSFETENGLIEFVRNPNLRAGDAFLFDMGTNPAIGEPGPAIAQLDGYKIFDPKVIELAKTKDADEKTLSFYASLHANGVDSNCGYIYNITGGA